MTIEEKAKRYDEVLEKAKNWYVDAQIDFKKSLENLFPELKESEDELHRKWILEYLYDGLLKSDEQFKGQFKAAIAWLEKQGKQKQEWSKEDETELTNTIIMLKEGASLHFNKKDITKTVDWLESLRTK